MAIEDPHSVVDFVLDGRNYRLSRSELERRLDNVRPRAIAKHAVRVKGIWYPVRQAFEVGSGIPGEKFTSHTARRHLARLGLELRGRAEPREGSAATATPHPSSDRHDAPDSHATWHTEASVQALVVSALESSGWQILSQANTATKERGVDVEAKKDGATVGIEVKGFPTRTYADPRRAGETKPTQPSTQAGHWYSQAVLAAMRLRTRHPEYRSVIAIPDFPRYRQLFSETRSSLDAASIEVWWVAHSGVVEGI